MYFIFFGALVNGNPVLIFSLVSCQFLQMQLIFADFILTLQNSQDFFFSEFLETSYIDNHVTCKNRQLFFFPVCLHFTSSSSSFFFASLCSLHHLVLCVEVKLDILSWFLTLGGKNQSVTIKRYFLQHFWQIFFMYWEENTFCSQFSKCFCHTYVLDELQILKNTLRRPDYYFLVGNWLVHEQQPDKVFYLIHIVFKAPKTITWL